VKAIITGMLLAAGVALGSAYLLDTEVQSSATEWYSTEAVRL
jgi:hypothetical protein